LGVWEEVEGEESVCRGGRGLTRLGGLGVVRWEFRSIGWVGVQRWFEL